MPARSPILALFVRRFGRFPPVNKFISDARSILLIEEYDALAAAIRSTLRKYAPGHACHAAVSFTEAEALAAKVRPELLVIDFDPPLPGVLEFLDRMKSLLPETRLLMITGSLPGTRILAAHRRAPALICVEKPFDLGVFGHAVESLVSPAASHAKQRPGPLRDLAVADIIPLFCVSRGTIVLNVEASGRRKGTIHIARGQITHAKADTATGIEGLEEMLRWRAPRMTTGVAQAALRRTIQGPWDAIFVEALQALADDEEPTPALSPRGEATRAGAGEGKKIVVVDDTEMLLIFVEEMLGGLEVQLSLATAPNAGEGLKLIASTLPDLVLLDYSLPDQNGDEVCRQLLENTATSRIPVIMMSGHLPEMTAAAARYENIVATLPKPFLSEALISLVTKTLADAPKVTPRQAAPLKDRNLGPASGRPADPPLTESKPPAGRSTATSSLQVIAPPKSPVAEAAPEGPRYSSPKVVPLSKIPFPVAGGLTRARFPFASDNAVVVGLPLEVVSMQFSEGLQMAAIRARPSSAIVSLQIRPQTLSAAFLAGVSFEVTGVNLDGRGQIDTMRLAPTARQIPAGPARDEFPIGGVAVLPQNGGRAMQLIPASVAPIRLQLLASFDLVGVELSASFSVACLVLKSRGGKMRVSLHPEAANTGATFQSAQVLLDHSARIAEVLLDAAA